MKLQAEHAEWLGRMYPKQSPDIPAAGMVEEAGELLHCVIKRTQCQLWGDEPRYADVDWQAKMRDAVGDCGIYCISYCNAAGLSFDEVMASATTPVVDASTMQCATELVHLATEFFRTRWPFYMAMYLSMLNYIAYRVLGDRDAMPAIERIWLEVKERTR